MCGIAGYVNLTGQPAERALIEQMTGALRHRGPDGAGYHLDGPLAMGMRRLAIIDLQTGDQPIYSRDGQQALIFNGEIYNYRELRAELRAQGLAFETQGDGEVIMRGVERWGFEACLQRLNGMFACALWDARRRELRLARDRLGIKPLYLYADGQLLAFASEIKALLCHPAIKPRIDRQGLANYLTFGHATAPRTMLQGVRKLPPAHHYLLALDQGLEREQRYWDIPLEPALAPSPAQAAEECHARLREAVRLQLVSDVPLGAFLSGGLDSSIIVGLMSELGAAPVRTFSVGFEAAGSYNELADARLVAQHFGAEHHELVLSAAALPEVLDQHVYHFDEPFGDAAALPMALLARFARQHVSVALSGEGSDEQWAGYRRYRAELLAQSLRRLPGRGAISALIRRLPRSRRLKQAARALEVPDQARRYGAWLTVLHAEQRARLYAPELLASLGDYDPLELYERSYPAGQSPQLNRLGYLDLRTWLPDTYLEKIDKSTMAASLEARVPFLDHTLLEWSMRLPPELKLRAGTSKWLLRQAFGRMLPPRTLAKRKHGLAVPLDPWFRGELRDWTRQILLDERTSARGLFRRAEVERMLDDHHSGRHVADSALWLLLNLELWQRCYLD